MKPPGSCIRSLRITGNEADAEEVTVDVFKQVWRMAERVDQAGWRGSP